MTLLEILISWDHSLFSLINQGFSNSIFDWFFPAITDLHKTTIGKILIPLLLFGSLYWRRKIQGLWLGLGLCFCLAIDDYSGKLLKDAFQRVRPIEVVPLNTIQRSEAGHFSFPSNHSMNMFCMAIFLGFFFPKARFPLMILAVLIAFSRVYNGVHFPSDVLGGAIFGMFVGFLGALTMKKVLKWQKS